MKSWNEFRKEILKTDDTRIHKVTNSLGVYQSYKWIRKNKWFDIGRPLTEHEFYSIIRKVNDYLAEELIKGNDIKFPHRMGKLELRKRVPSIKIVNGKIKTDLPIDWDKTLKLWYEDEQSFNNKTLVRMEAKEVFGVRYNKANCNYNNQSYYKFRINRDIKRRLKENIKEKSIDAFTLWTDI